MSRVKKKKKKKSWIKMVLLLNGKLLPNLNEKTELTHFKLTE